MDRMLKVLLEAIRVGRSAGQQQLDRLQHQGNRYVVMDDPEFTDDPRVYGGMLDLCGFAHIRISGRSSLVRYIKRYGRRVGYRSYVLDTPLGRVEISKAYPKGYSLYLPIELGRQEISVKKAAYQKALEVLERHGIYGWIYSRLD